MTKAQHTPGPWEIDETRGKHRVRINGTGWQCFAKIIVRMDGDTEDLAEGIANANLIAAAPELLEAAIDDGLDKAHDALSVLLESESAGNDDIREAAITLCEALNAHHEKRRAAIAKATRQAA